MFLTAVLRRTTGRTGLPVNPNPKYTLTVLYDKILRALAKLPENSAYRKYTQEIVAQRAAIVYSAGSVCEIEESINAGVVEEIILQAENELRLARHFLYSKPWEPLISQPPPDQWKWPPAKIT